MCGRYVTVSSPTLLAERFSVEEVRIEDKEADYNVTPRAEVPVVAVSRGKRVLDLVRWGLVPSWAKNLSIGDKQINARADTVATKPAYRKAFERRRCLMPADGFYEWQVVPGRKQKQPYFIARADREPMVFAGLYEVWRDRADPDAEWMRTCALITTDANDTLAPIHDRMPVVLPEDAWEEWLDPENHDTASLLDLLVPAPSEDFVAYPISKLVNKPENQGPELLEPIDPDDDDGELRLL